MKLDSSCAMTSKECRALWQALKLRYADIEPYDLDALQGYIAIECAESCRKGETPRYTIPRRKDDSLCCKMDADRGVIAFWDGASRGTAQSFALSKEFDNPLRIIRVDLSHGSSAS